MQNNVNSGTNIALPVTSSQMPQMVNVSAAHQQAMSMGHLPNNIELNMNVPGGMAPMTVNHTSYIPTQPQNQMQAPPASIQSSQSQVHQQHAQQQQQSHISNQNYTNGNGAAQQQPMHMSGGSVSHVPYTMPMSQQDIHSQQQIVPQPQQQQQQSANVSVATANYPMSAPASVTSINTNNLCDMSASSGVQNNPSNNHNAINSQNASNATNMNVNNATNYANQNTNLNSGCVVGGGGNGGSGIVAANSDRTNACATSASIVTGNIVMTGQASQTIVDNSAAKVMSPSCAAGTAPSVAANNTNNPNANGSATAANASASCSSTASAQTANNANTTVVTSTTSAVKYTTTPENETGMNAVDGATSKATTSAEDGQSVEDSERYVWVSVCPITVSIRFYVNSS